MAISNIMAKDLPFLSGLHYQQNTWLCFTMACVDCWWISTACIKVLAFHHICGSCYPQVPLSTVHLSTVYNGLHSQLTYHCLPAALPLLSLCLCAACKHSQPPLWVPQICTWYTSVHPAARIGAMRPWAEAWMWPNGLPDFRPQSCCHLALLQARLLQCKTQDTGGGSGLGWGVVRLALGTSPRS